MQLDLGIRRQEIDEGSLNHAADQFRPAFKIPHKPFQRQRIDEWNDRVGKTGQHQRQRQQKSKR
ncbi:MAG TPA: hypothetical protein VFQ26_07320 [Nitrospiraceae bacterium]|nr:hypothetical protein [Nitrospiraceae bacterium]